MLITVDPLKYYKTNPYIRLISKGIKIEKLFINQTFRNKIKNLYLVIIFLLLLSCSKGKEKPEIVKVTVNSEIINCFEMFEVDVVCNAVYSNPYDYDQVTVRGVFYSPSGKTDTVDGFYCKNFTYTPPDKWPVSDGSHNWKVRYTPTEAGKWKFQILCQDKNGKVSTIKLKYKCLQNNDQGYLRKGKDNYLQFDNKTSFFPIGLNIAWWNENLITDYKRWIDSCSQNGINFLRVWVTSWGFAFEWNDTPLKNYEIRQDKAYFLDWLLEQASSKDIYIQLCLNNHGQLSTIHDPEWNNNPYNIANGGYCEKPSDFFTKNEAKKTFKNKLRYTIARYGYSTHIASWEIFNEINNVDDYEKNVPEINRWINEISSYIKQKDVNKHLVSISYNSEIFQPEVWNMPTIDYTQLHYYMNNDELEDIVYNGIQNYLAEYKKPVLDAEFGLCSEEIDLLSIDSAGYHIHNVLWGTSFSGAMGCGISWWWYNYIEPAGLFHIYKPLSEFFRDVDFSKNSYKPCRPVCFTTEKTDFIIGPAFSTFGKSPETNFTINPNGSITPPASKMARYIFGNIWNAEFKKALCFNIKNNQKTLFSIHTSFFVSQNPILSVTLNGKNVLTKACKANKIYNIDVPVGNNQIFIDNLGKDWIEIKQFSVQGYSSAIKSYALKSDSSVIGWVLNKNFNYGNIYKKGIPKPIKKAMLTFDEMSDGIYKVEWFNCENGKFINETNSRATNNHLTINCPDLLWDYAYKITFHSK